MKRFALFLLCLLPLPALAGQSIPSGVTDQYIYFKLVDSTDHVTPETGISVFTVYYSKDGGASTQISTPTINEVDATNMPGVYELLVNTGTTVAAGNVIENMTIAIAATGCDTAIVAIEIVDAADEAGIATAVETEINDRLPSATTKTNLDTAFASTLAEPTGVPAADAPLWTKVGYLYSFGFRNERIANIDSNGDGEIQHKDDAGNVEFEKTVSTTGDATTEGEARTTD